MWEQRSRLEPIQEESEWEDETTGSKTTEGEEEEEERTTAKVIAEDESEEDEDAGLRVMRPSRTSRSFSQESCLHMQPESQNDGASDQSTRLDSSAEASPPVQRTRLSTSVKLRMKVRFFLFLGLNSNEISGSLNK